MKNQKKNIQKVALMRKARPKVMILKKRHQLRTVMRKQTKKQKE